MGLDWIVQGGPVMYPILGCSLVSLTITLERALYWWRDRRHRDDGLVTRMGELVGEGRIDEAEALGSSSRDRVARILRFGITHLNVSLEAALRMAAGQEIRGMGRFLRVLDTIVTVAPLLGILGTVLGIISAFDVMSGGAVDNPVEVTGGIAQALLTTAAGLVVAVISLLPFNYFSSRMELAIGEMEGQLTSFEIMFEKRRRDGGGER